MTQKHLFYYPMVRSRKCGKVGHK